MLAVEFTIGRWAKKGTDFGGSGAVDPELGFHGC